MKILNEASKKFKCNHCLVEAEYEDTDINYEELPPGYDEYDNIPVYYVKCPVCSKHLKLGFSAYQKAMAYARYKSND